MSGATGRWLLVDRFPWSVPLRQITPLHPGPHPMRDPVDHLPVIPPPATTTITHRQEWPQPFPLGIGLVTPVYRHIQNNDLPSRQSHDRPDSP
jgi:hypothetical protein